MDYSSVVAVVGAGPAGLMAAETLAQAGIRVTIFDRMASAGRKFLLAGRGGLNLTHSEPLEALLGRYGAAAPRLAPAIAAFPPDALRAWSAALGQPNFVGSSGRVFPQAFKTSPLLRAWLRRLDALGVMFRPRHRWTGWQPDGTLAFTGPEGAVAVRPRATILALGGASWPQLGADGSWIAPIAAAGVATAPLRPANCGFLVDWSERFAETFNGTPLKGIALTFGTERRRGEALVTRTGLEGGGIYGLAAGLRDTIAAEGAARLAIDLKPGRSATELEARLAGAERKQSLATLLRKAVALPPVAIGLLREAERAEAAPLNILGPRELALRIKAVPLRLIGTAPLARAISTAGGVMWEAVDEAFMLRRRPGSFVAGEMLDWEAPTGGYLLQACFSTGVAAAQGARQWLTAAAQAGEGRVRPA